jgi:hypothetical protein
MNKIHYRINEIDACIVFGTSTTTVAAAVFVGFRPNGSHAMVQYQVQ